MLTANGVVWQRRSDLDTNPSNPAARILLIDKIGELRAWWGTATIGFVGGSFGPRGGQNMIEPAAYGVATCFGPQTHNFRDVVAMLLAAKAAIVVENGEALTEFAGRALKDTAFAAELGNRAREVVNSQLGATSRTADLLDRIANLSLPADQRAAA
jgi:3-deoxy-D-manno-octulosonic-acid transferase